MRVAIIGAAGRMGQAIVRSLELEGVTLVGAVEHGESKALGRDAGEVAGAGTLGVEISPDLGSALLGADCVIDFSSPRALSTVVQVASQRKIAFVSGTTGIDAGAEAALDAAAKSIPVLWSPNMSVGVHVLADLVKRAIAMLGPGFDVEIVESHHRLKTDAPSGTAKRLFEAVKEARSSSRALSGREGIVGKRTDDEVAILALRGGDVVGDHTVHLLGAGERIELTHRATSRDLFARGALRAAIALHKKSPGRYTMADIVESP